MKNLFLLFRKIYIKCNKTDTGYDLYGILRVTTIQIVKYKNNDNAHISTDIPLSVFFFCCWERKKKKNYYDFFDSISKFKSIRDLPLYGRDISLLAVKYRTKNHAFYRNENGFDNHF